MLSLRYRLFDGLPTELDREEMENKDPDQPTVESRIRELRRLAKKLAMFT